MGRLVVDVGVVCDRGLARRRNEDAAGYVEPAEPDILEQKGRLYVVADGMGGHRGGEVASEQAVREVLHAYYEHPADEIAAALRSALLQAHRQIQQGAQEKETRGMGTTIVAAVVRGETLIVANVGDSPAYLIRQGEIRQLSETHSWVGVALQKGLLSTEEALTHPRRNVITRYLGMSEPLEVFVSEKIPLQAGDTLLLCTDGLSSLVSLEEMTEIAGDRSYTAAEATEYLIRLTHVRGAPDNVTALVVRFDTSGETLPGQPRTW